MIGDTPYLLDIFYYIDNYKELGDKELIDEMSAYNKEFTALKGKIDSAIRKMSYDFPLCIVLLRILVSQLSSCTTISALVRVQLYTTPVVILKTESEPFMT